MKKRIYSIGALILAGSLWIQTPAAIVAGDINSPAVPGYYTRGLSMYGLENYAGTVDQLRQAARSRALTPDEQRRLQYAEAMCVFHQGRYQEAETLLRAWLDCWSAAPGRADALMSVGDCLFESSYAEALKVYDRVNADALANADRSAELAYRTGYCCLKLAMWDRADAAFAALAGNSEYKDAASFYRAYILYAQGRFAQAKQAFESVKTATPPGNMSDFYLSQIYYQEGDYTRALSTARSLLTRKDVAAPYIAEANRVAGESLYLTDRPDQAIPYLRKYAQSVSRPVISAMYMLGLSEYAAGDYAAAVNTLRPVSSDDSSMGQNAYLYIGQALLHQGDTSGAIMAFDRALNMTHDPEAREAAYYNYAVAKYAGASVPFGSSVKVFEEFLQLYPESRYGDEVRRYIISGYLTDNNYEAALQAINRTRHPSAEVLAAKQQVLYTLGARSLASNDAPAAVKYLTEANSLKKHNATLGRETELTLGEALLRAGNPAEAVPHLQEYLRGTRTDNTPVAYFDLGYAQLQQHSYDAAGHAFQEVISNPGNLGNDIVADAWSRLGDSYYYRKDWNRAAEAYSRAYDLGPAAGDYALFQQAVMQGYADDFNGKLSTLQRLEQEFPSSALMPDALLEMTEAQLRTGQAEAAMSTWRRLIDAYPSTSQGRAAYLQLASTLLDRGRTTDAEESYRALIALHPTSDEAALAAESLKRMLASQGRLQEYNEFITGIDNAPRMDAGEADRLAFEAAEEQFTHHNSTTLMKKYVQQYGNEGAYSLQAYSYLMDNADAAGNVDDAYEYATHIADRWPDNAAAEQAFAIMGQTEYDRGNGEQALHSWQQLERRASTPSMTNEARMGIMRVARDLGRADDLIAAADAVLASSTLGAEDKTEAAFSRGLALRLKGDDRGAIAVWQPLSVLTDDQYGAKSAVYMAETQLDNGDKDGAHSTATTFVNSGTPHSYWLARGFIVLSDALRAQGKQYEADEYLRALRQNYPGVEADIFTMIDERLEK